MTRFKILTMIEQDLTIQVIVECLKGSNEKYELNEKDGQIKLDFVFDSLFFPFYYGYIPGTRGGDGDMLDVLLVSSESYERGQAVECKCVGYAEVIDRGEVDNKFVMVPIEDIRLGSHEQITESRRVGYYDIKDIPEDKLKEWENFWLEVAKQKNKVMEIKAWHGREKAMEEIIKSIKY